MQRPCGRAWVASNNTHSTGALFCPVPSSDLHRADDSVPRHTVTWSWVPLRDQVFKPWSVGLHYQKVMGPERRHLGEVVLEVCPWRRLWGTGLLVFIFNSCYQKIGSFVCRYIISTVTWVNQLNLPWSQVSLPTFKAHCLRHLVIGTETWLAQSPPQLYGRTLCPFYPIIMK